MWADAQAFRGKSLVNNYRNKGLGKQIGYFTKKNRKLGPVHKH